MRSLLSLPHIVCLLLLAAFLTSTRSAAASDDDGSFSSYRWGTYRPNLYFGVRARSASSPLFGLAWSGPFEDVGHLNSFRHDAEERDHVTKYGWLQHDGDGFGLQEILDREKRVNITTTFINPVDASGQLQRDRWISRIELQPLDVKRGETVSINLLWYVALEKGSGHSARILQGVADKREDVQLEIASDNGQTLLLTAHLPETSEHPTLKWWKAKGKQTKSQQRSLPCVQSAAFVLSTSHRSALLWLLSSATFSSVRWAGLNVADSWNAKHWLHNLTLSAAQAQYAAMQRKGDAQEEAMRRAQEASFAAILPNALQPDSSLTLLQHIVTLPYSLSFSLIPRDAAAAVSAGEVEAALATVPARVAAFTSRFQSAFPLASPYSSPSHVAFAQAAVSNLIGGIGFFHGPSLIETSRTVAGAGGSKKRKTEVKETSALSLLSTVPSRSFFPRGFLWDEGFHQHLLPLLSLPLSVELLRSWLSHVLPSGWLPREQILGEEARRRVPPEFRVQKPTIANPPVLVLAMGRMVTRFEDRIRAREARRQQQQAEQVEISADGSVRGSERRGDGDDKTEEDAALTDELALLSSFLSSAYPTLQRHADWYFHTQSAIPIPKNQQANASSSLSSPSTFRWAGRSLDHCLASGFDDYPRAPFVPKSSDGRRKRERGQTAEAAEGESELMLREGEAVEGHVDLHAWMTALTQCMAHIARFLSLHGDASRREEWSGISHRYRLKSLQLLSKLDVWHWNAQHGMYCDYAYRRGRHHHICHLGYVTLIPLALGLVSPASPHFSQLIGHLRQPALWTQFGLRSLSADDAKFGTAEDYWRGHVWININYMTAVALAYYAAIGQAAPATAAETQTGGEGWLQTVKETLLAWTGATADSRQWSDEFRHLMDHSSPERWEEEQGGGGGALSASLSGAYAELRDSVISAVYSNYVDRGFLFENYNSSDGRGRGSHPFTGWTALVVNLMAEKY